MENKTLIKPWGKEILIYEDERVSMWIMYIKPGGRTSLHYHPNKKTKLISLSELIIIHTRCDISDETFITKLGFLEEKVFPASMIHRSENSFDKEIRILEIETPPIKENLIRIGDDYGRTGKPMEKHNEIEVK